MSNPRASKADPESPPVAPRQVSRLRGGGTVANGARSARSAHLSRSDRATFFVSPLLAFALFAVAASTAHAADPVDFARDVKPILHDHCVKCHAGTQKKGGFSINTRESLVKGGESGPGLVEKKSSESELIRRVTTDNADLRMPAEGKPLTERQIGILKAWVDQGAVWEQGFAFAKEVRRAPLAPRKVELPSGDAGANPIDRILSPYFAKHEAGAAQLVSDRAFHRRASLDLVGLIPTPEQLDAFEKDARPDKRERLVDSLLADRRNYADHWLTFWNDALRNTYQGTGFIDGGRKQITRWLYRSLYDNVPYDRFTRELIGPVPGSEGFTWGIVWRGVVNESQRREIQNAQNVAQVFLGTNLKCASCHDSFVNYWKLTDAYALANVFADSPMEIHRCDKPTGEKSETAFLYRELGTIDPAAAKAERMKQLAELVVDPKNGRFPRTIVNRLWSKLMGRGLVEPVDDLDAEPWSQDLLDYLATDLVEHKYDLKHTLQLIATSRAYRMASVGVPAQGQSGEFVFRGPWVKRMTAEQFVDAVRTITGVWPQISGDLVTVDGRGQGGQLLAVAEALKSDHQPSPSDRAAEKKLAGRLGEAKWIWAHEKAMSAPAGESVYLRKERKLNAKPARALLIATADNAFEFYVNGRKVAASDNWEKLVLVDVSADLREGANAFAMKATNAGSGPNAAGAIAAIAGFDAAGKLVWSDVTDATWSASMQPGEGWQRPGFDAKSWKLAIAFAGAKDAPWGVAQRAQGTSASASADVSAILGDAPIRSALMPLDALQSSLGRPNREQVVTVRESRATMLQALELANGPILDELLRQGASPWNSQSPDAATAIDRLYRTALGRAPTDAEKRLALELTGSPMDESGLADLLWTLVLSPEFQLVQ